MWLDVLNAMLIHYKNVFYDRAGAASAQIIKFATDIE